MLQDPILHKSMGGAVFKHSQVFITYASLQLKSNMKDFLLIFVTLWQLASEQIGDKCTKSRFQKKIEVAEIE